MAEHDVTIPDIVGRVSVTEPGVFSGSKLLVDGQPAPKAGWGKFWLTRTDGSRVEARLVAGFTTWVPAVMVGGIRYDVGPKLPVILAIVAALPIGLVFVGGLVGGLSGGLGWGFNNQIARTSWPMAVKLVVMLAVAGASFGVFAVLAGALHLAVGR